MRINRSLLRLLRANSRSCENKFPGGHTGGETPEPIPNSVVKPSRADDTAPLAEWESRSLPGLKFTKPRQRRGFFIFGQSAFFQFLLPGI